MFWLLNGEVCRALFSLRTIVERQHCDGSTLWLNLVVAWLKSSLHALPATTLSILLMLARYVPFVMIVALNIKGAANGV